MQKVAQLLYCHFNPYMNNIEAILISIHSLKTNKYFNSKTTASVFISLLHVVLLCIYCDLFSIINIKRHFNEDQILE